MFRVKLALHKFKRSPQIERANVSRSFETPWNNKGIKQVSDAQISRENMLRACLGTKRSAHALSRDTDTTADLSLPTTTVVCSGCEFCVNYEIFHWKIPPKLGNSSHSFGYNLQPIICGFRFQFWLKRYNIPHSVYRSITGYPYFAKDSNVITSRIKSHS